ncbi:MAG: preprotein translocase subunit YajC [Victivallaceae bacterium]
MFNFVTIAAADGACSTSAQGAGGMIGLVPMIVIFAVMFYFMYRSQKKQAQKRQEMIDKIVKGSDVIVGGGIYGTIVSVKDKTFIVEIADKVNIEVTKGGVNGIIGAGDVAATE